MKKINKIDYNSTKITIDKLENDKKELATSLLNEIEFMTEALNQLKAKVDEDGVVTSMCQGKYSIDRANPALNQYNALIKNYTSCIKHLNDLLPKEDTVADDEFEEF